jgi:2-polyprenyl-3-methyl-5-hydroxy-6-metoxy-1,4-benzoquinol methylase
VLSRRAVVSERMDAPDFSRQEVIDTFQFIGPVNRWFGGHRPLLSFFARESNNWSRDQTYRVVDVGCGAGDIPVALVRWARQRGFRLQVHAIDHHPETVRLAQQTCRAYPEIVVSQRDMADLRGENADYVLASMFLHHFRDDDVPAVLTRLLAQCRDAKTHTGTPSGFLKDGPKVVINDLLRTPLAYAGTWLFSLVASPVFRHDARLSVRKGFTIPELHRLLALTGLRHYRLETHFFYRFLLVLYKENPS